MQAVEVEVEAEAEVLGNLRGFRKRRNLSSRPAAQHAVEVRLVVQMDIPGEKSLRRGPPFDEGDGFRYRAKEQNSGVKLGVGRIWFLPKRIRGVPTGLEPEKAIAGNRGGRSTELAAEEIRARRPKPRDIDI
jgi:hypothetical protein